MCIGPFIGKKEYNFVKRYRKVDYFIIIEIIIIKRKKNIIFVHSVSIEGKKWKKKKRKWILFVHREKKIVNDI